MKDGLPDEKILIIKTAWGGKTLAGDFRPPSSAKGSDPYCTGSTCAEVGHYYTMMMQDVSELVKPGVIGEMFPDLAGLTPKISGFGWWQGWNDGCDLNMTAAYETNMVNLIKDLRAEWNSNLAVSIATAGFNGFNGAEDTRTPKSLTPWVDMQPKEKIGTACSIDPGCRRLDIVLSQFAAANATRHADLGGGVVTMETRGFWREAHYSPNKGQIYHYWHNAETYYLVGQAMAKGMLGLLQGVRYA